VASCSRGLWPTPVRGLCRTFRGRGDRPNSLARRSSGTLTAVLSAGIDEQRSPRFRTVADPSTPLFVTR
jgi:hypothetical protein